MSTVTRPILRYHGGKFTLSDWIIGHFPTHRIYVEPFGGAASILLLKPRCYAEIYNDLDGEIVNLFRVARDRGPELVRVLEMTPFSREEYHLSFEKSKGELEQARRTVVRSMMGFGSNSLNREIKSGFRVTANMSHTTPASDWRNYPECLVAVIDRLRGVAIEQKDASSMLIRHDGKDTLFYCDPPYVHDSRSMVAMHGNRGYAHEMSDQQHIKLSKTLKATKGMVVLSGYHCNLYDHLYEKWNFVERAAMADGARPRTEVLWFNKEAWARMPTMRMF